MRARKYKMWKPIIDRLCKRLGYRMRCQKSPKCKEITLRVWKEPTRTYMVNGVKVVPKPAHGFYIVLLGRNYRITLADRPDPTVDAYPRTFENILSQILTAIDLLGAWRNEVETGKALAVE